MNIEQRIDRPQARARVRISAAQLVAAREQRPDGIGGDLPLAGRVEAAAFRVPRVNVLPVHIRADGTQPALEALRTPEARHALRADMTEIERCRFNGAVGGAEDAAFADDVSRRLLTELLFRHRGYGDADVAPEDLARRGKEALVELLGELNQRVNARPWVHAARQTPSEAALQLLATPRMQQAFCGVLNKIHGYHEEIAYRNTSALTAAALLGAGLVVSAHELRALSQKYHSGALARPGWRYDQAARDYIKTMPEDWYKKPLRWVLTEHEQCDADYNCREWTSLDPVYPDPPSSDWYLGLLKSVLKSGVLLLPGAILLTDSRQAHARSRMAALGLGVSGLTIT